jgi:hypothetical protein
MQKAARITMRRSFDVQIRSLLAAAVIAMVVSACARGHIRCSTHIVSTGDLTECQVD